VTEVEAQKAITMLVTAYPTSFGKMDGDQQAATRKIYREMILDIDADTAACAIRGLIATQKFMPSIAEVREACMIVKYGRQRPGGDAWGDVLAAMSRYGRRRTPGRDFAFDDPLVARAVSALGWTELCTSDLRAADRARFIELYEQLAGYARADAQAGTGLLLESGRATRELPPAAVMSQLMPGDS
jgi:hypothetical protein